MQPKELKASTYTYSGSEHCSHLPKGVTASFLHKQLQQ